MRKLSASIVLAVLVGGSIGASAERSPTSAEGLCQTLAIELFPEFRTWLEAHPELRPLDAFAYLSGSNTQKRIATVPMEYDFPEGTRELRLIATFPDEIRRQYPSVNLSCEGVFASDEPNRIQSITFNGQTRRAGPDDDWTF